MGYETVMQHFKTPSALAEALVPYGIRISPQAIYKWARSGVPPERASVIESASGGVCRCEVVCDDVDWVRDAKGVPVAWQVRVPKHHKPRRQAA